MNEVDRSPPLLGVSGLRKRFGDHEVLGGIDLDVARGDRIAILGASGSGKSTLLRCLNFMELPSAGTIALAGPADRPRNLGQQRRTQLSGGGTDTHTAKSRHGVSSSSTCFRT